MGCAMMIIDEAKKNEIQKKWRIQEIKQELETIDAKSLRALRAVNLGTSTNSDEAFLLQLEERATVLRNELNDLTRLS